MVIAIASCHVQQPAMANFCCARRERHGSRRSEPVRGVSRGDLAPGLWLLQLPGHARLSVIRMALADPIGGEDAGCT